MSVKGRFIVLGESVRVGIILRKPGRDSWRPEDVNAELRLEDSLGDC